MVKNTQLLRPSQKAFMLFIVLFGLIVSLYLYQSQLDIQIHNWAVNWQKENGIQTLWGYLSSMGQDSFQIMVCIAFGIYYYRKGNYTLSRAWYFSSVISLFVGVVGQIVKFIVARPRPKMLPEYDPLWFEFGAKLHSWPSGHTLTTFAWIACLWPFYPAHIRALMFMFAVCVSYSRIGIGAHYMSDVISGAVLGYALAMVLREKLKLTKQTY